MRHREKHAVGLTSNGDLKQKGLLGSLAPGNFPNWLEGWGVDGVRNHRLAGIDPGRPVHSRIHLGVLSFWHYISVHPRLVPLCQLFFFHNHASKSMRICFNVCRLPSPLLQTLYPARHLSVLSSDIAKQIHARLVLLFLPFYSHNHTLKSSIISSFFCILPSPRLSTSVSCSSFSRCLLQALHHQIAHVRSALLYSFVLTVTQ